MARTFTLYLDQLKEIIAQVEENAKKNPLAAGAITLVVAEGDDCLKLFQKAGHDWLFLDGERFRESK